MIYYTVPFDSSKNIGQYYNKFVNTVPSDSDYICFIDADTIFTTSDYGCVIESAINRYPNVDCFTCYTNRVNCLWQVPDGVDKITDDYKYHRNFGEMLKDKYGNECVDMTNQQLFSGMFFIIKKSAWKKIGGALSQGMLGVDNDIHRKIISHGLKLYLMKGLYVYHWHRGSCLNTSTKHLSESKPIKNVVTKPKKDNDIIIYTCITGNYDIPQDDFKKKEGYRYIMISDKPIQTNSWENIVCDFGELRNLSNVKKQRYVKCHPYQFFDDDCLTVWVDGNLPVNDKLYKYIAENKFYDVTFKKHPQRDCIYDECDAVVVLRKETSNITESLKRRYKQEGFPYHYGLMETNIIIRKGKEFVKRLMEEWWQEIKKNSHRDQLSINYAIWKQGVKDKVHVVTTCDFPPMGHKRGQASKVTKHSNVTKVTIQPTVTKKVKIEENPKVEEKKKFEVVKVSTPEVRKSTPKRDIAKLYGNKPISKPKRIKNM